MANENEIKLPPGIVMIDGQRHQKLDVDVMTHYGERYYTTCTVYVPLSPELVRGGIMWMTTTDEIRDAVYRQVPSMQKRDDVRMMW